MRPDVKAPGLTWNERAGGNWEARWQASSRMVKRGYTIKSRTVWVGSVPTPAEEDFIVDRCMSLQEDMNVWGRGGAPLMRTVFDGSVAALIGTSTPPLSLDVKG